MTEQESLDRDLAEAHRLSHMVSMMLVAANTEPVVVLIALSKSLGDLCACAPRREVELEHALDATRKFFDDAVAERAEREVEEGTEQ